MNGFQLVESDMDYRVAQKTISREKLTPSRFKAIHRFARKNSFSTVNCGHDFDCCGCLCSQQFEIGYTPENIVIRVTESFNY